jgi:hypothetical protein
MKTADLRVSKLFEDCGGEVKIFATITTAASVDDSRSRGFSSIGYRDPFVAYRVSE